MKKLSITILLFGTLFLSCLGQDLKQKTYDSIFLYSNSSSTFRLKMLEKCDDATVIAEQDIEKQEIQLLIAGGTAPIVYTTDHEFEEKYLITYFDYGSLAAEYECMLKYNLRVFEYLYEKYGKNWQKEIRKDVIGYTSWRKKNKKITIN